MGEIVIEGRTATDISPEPLEVARGRQYGPAPVTFQLADAYALQEVPGQFDMAFIGFFWSHVLRADLPRFLQGLHARLGPGAAVTVLDNRYFPDRGQFTADMAAVGTDVEWTSLRYFWLATFRLG
jgi:ubiquinone/menaquinone biosynthesis C-methylase UbiE